MTLDAPDHLERMLTRLKLTAIRDQLDSLLDEAARRELTLREALTFLCEREIARKDQRRIDMAMGLARFPFARDLAGLDFGAQPSIDKAQIRELATGRFIANGEAVLLLGPPGRVACCTPVYVIEDQAVSERDRVFAEGAARSNRRRARRYRPR